VRYVYGDTLKAANGRCVETKKELTRLSRSVDEFVCYVVEVCVDCGWNYMIRSSILGRAQAGYRARPESTYAVLTAGSRTALDGRRST
jgi:hypothetical protein